MTDATSGEFEPPAVLLGELKATLSRVEADLQTVEQELHAVRGSVAALEALQPKTGEIIFLGRKWGRWQRAIVGALVGLLLGLAGVAYRHHAGHEDRVEAILTGLVPTVAVLVAEKEKGSRATGPQMRRVVHCVRARFLERIHGIEEGRDLPEPGRMGEALARECFEDLDQLFKELGDQ